MRQFNATDFSSKLWNDFPLRVRNSLAKTTVTDIFNYNVLLKI